MSDDEGTSRQDAPPTGTLIDRLPSWTWPLVLVGLVLVVTALSRLWPAIFWDRFVDRYIWRPIVEDAGYNPFNTALLAIVLVLLLLWVYRLSVDLRETIDLSMILAAVPWMTLGSVYRVLEDADNFAPFGVRRSCLPDAEGGFLATCFGIFFITPIIYVVVLLIAVGAMLLAHEARRVAERTTVARGLQFLAGTFLALVLLYAALWRSDPVWIARMVDPIWVLMAAAVSYAIVHRHAASERRISPHLAIFAYGLFVLLPGLLLAFGWIAGDHWGAGPTLPPRPWVLVAIVVAPGLVTLACLALARILTNRHPWRRDAPLASEGRAAAKPTVPLVLLVILLILIGLATLASLVGVSLMEETVDRSPSGWARDVALLAAGPLLVVATVMGLAAWVRRGGPFHGQMVYFFAPINLVMVFGQVADALLTALGIDVYGYHEKHVLPRFLIDQVAGGQLPWGLNQWATTIVMVPLKTLVVLMVIWIIDVAAKEPRQNLVGLIKLAIIMVGFSPAVRNGVRLAMGI